MAVSGSQGVWWVKEKWGDTEIVLDRVGREGDTPRMETGTWTADTWGWVVVGVSVVGTVLAAAWSRIVAWWRGARRPLPALGLPTLSLAPRARRPLARGVCPWCGASGVYLRHDGQANRRYHRGCLEGA